MNGSTDVSLPTPRPCCGYLVHDDGPGSWSICPICRWEDDLTQLRWPTLAPGANRQSLVQAQSEFARAEANSAPIDLAVHTDPGLLRDPAWRPINVTIDNFESPNVQETPWPDDRRVLFWWRDTFWRR
jgi:hypothetical protein